MAMSRTRIKDNFSKLLGNKINAEQDRHTSDSNDVGEVEIEISGYMTSE